MLCMAFGGCDSLLGQQKSAPPTPYDFSLSLDLTPVAYDRLKAANDDLMVTIFYYGYALPEYKSEADRLNRIDLGYQTARYASDARYIKITSTNLNARTLYKVEGREPYVLVTVYPIFQSGFEDELYDHKLSCMSYVGKVADLQKYRKVIQCDKYKE